jgi:hypothetical protein
LYFTLPSSNALGLILSFLIVSVSFFVVGVDILVFVVVEIDLSFPFLVGIEVVFLDISCEYILQLPIVRKIDNKTILNKFIALVF